MTATICSHQCSCNTTPITLNMQALVDWSLFPWRLSITHATGSVKLLSDFACMFKTSVGGHVWFNACIGLGWLIHAPKSDLTIVITSLDLGSVLAFNIWFLCPQLQTTATAAMDCTIAGISQFCLAHRFQPLWQQSVYNYPITATSCYQNWLNRNFPPSPASASGAVLSAIGCEEENGRYCCI